MNENLRPFEPGYDPRRGSGKKGRSGRPSGVAREACTKAFGSRVKFLKDVIDGKTGPFLHKDGQAILDDKGKPVRVGADISDRLKAMDLLGKYGGLQKIETETRETTLEDLLHELAAAEHERAEARADPPTDRVPDTTICYRDRHQQP